MALSDEQVKKFHEDGFLLIENFLSSEEADALQEECHRLVEDMKPEEHNTVFTTLEMKRTSDEYFMTSGDKIRFFFEDGAKDENGKLKVDKQLSLNKIGHALHELSPPFKKVTFSKQIQGIAKSLNMEDPVVCQSMYIFKQPGIGGEVVPHQDSTFLYTDPMKLVGFWIALEDADVENGCLWFYPGSHKSGLYNNRKMIRNPNQSSEKGGCTVFTADPYIFDDRKFIPVEVKKGGLVILHGEVVHKSERNSSTRSRHIYTFHTFDQHGTTYSKENWLQPTKELPFPRLYATES
ncbi:hypothetical protein ACJMK2_039690 [Sinanodonta woodiana]|uniref:Phytanoyl-CoA dioxygenase n=1 Tax=Sinanodonta woodiana TaxID=1069815 RepID=A0ABD3WCW5_SINWO